MRRRLRVRSHRSRNRRSWRPRPALAIVTRRRRATDALHARRRRRGAAAGGGAAVAALEQGQTRLHLRWITRAKLVRRRRVRGLTALNLQRTTTHAGAGALFAHRSWRRHAHLGSDSLIARRRVRPEVGTRARSPGVGDAHTLSWRAAIPAVGRRCVLQRSAKRVRSRDAHVEALRGRRDLQVGASPRPAGAGSPALNGPPAAERPVGDAFRRRPGAARRAGASSRANAAGAAGAGPRIRARPVAGSTATVRQPQRHLVAVAAVAAVAMQLGRLRVGLPVRSSILEPPPSGDWRRRRRHMHTRLPG
mmetsp:Transcript_10528/g.36732  ORF Transcript_10528/g.36732 Transcript_10528/m.36732 type:complete len:306 (+) Transcript_10528:2231-3148(+)